MTGWVQLGSVRGRVTEVPGASGVDSGRSGQLMG